MNLPGPQAVSPTLRQAQAPQNQARDAATDLLALNLVARDAVVLLGPANGYSKRAKASAQQHGALIAANLSHFGELEQRMLANALASVIAERSEQKVCLEYRDLGLLDEQGITSAQRTVMIATGLDRAQASEILIATGGSARAAIISILAKVPPQQAQQMLSASEAD